MQKVLARAGIASRRTVEALIAAGRVSVNGAQVTVPGTRVDAGRDVVVVDGNRIVLQGSALETWAIHKPRGMMTTLSDPQGRPTVRALISDLPLRLYPVGRLDWDAEGLLLMTNDGELTHRLTHPSFGVRRTYVAVVKGTVLDSTLAKLRGPLDLEDGPIQTLAVELSPGEGRRSVLTITVAEGRNHLVKNLCAAVGHEVERLVRLAYGGIELGQLPLRGRRRLLTPELGKLRAAAGLP